MNKFVELYGSIIGVVMVCSFAINLFVARFTRIKNIFLTGHIFFWIAFVCVAVGVDASITGWKLIAFAVFFTSLYIIFAPWLIFPLVKNVTGTDSFTIGHSTIGLSLFASLISKIFGNSEHSTEDVKIPKKLSFLKENIVITSIVMGLVNLFFGFGFVDAIMNGFTFGAGIAILLLGVRMIMTELMPAFNGIAEKFIPNAIPALDCPMIFGYAPNAVVIGFVVSMLSSIATLFVFVKLGVFNVVILPLTIGCFFDIGPAAVFANKVGGLRGTIISCTLCGVLLTIFAGLSIQIMSNTAADFFRAFGGNDFSLLAFTLRGALGIFS